jgi:hypothetical protein
MLKNAIGTTNAKSISTRLWTKRRTHTAKTVQIIEPLRELWRRTVRRTVRQPIRAKSPTHSKADASCHGVSPNGFEGFESRIATTSI